MYVRQSPPDALLRLAGFQDGVVSREQVLAHGVTDNVLRRLTRDLWRPIDRGTYLTANVEPGWDALAWAGVLAGGDGARLGPLASGWQHELLPQPPMPIDVLVGHQRRVRDNELWRFVRERDGTRQRRTVGSPPRLTVEDTVVDLASAGSESEVIALVTNAVQRRRTTPRRLALALRERNRHPHRRWLLAALGDAEAGAHSTLEVRYLRDVERAHGLPTGSRQQVVRGGRHETDVKYRQFLLVVELDGQLFHTGLAAFVDMDRDNDHAMVGFLTLRFGWIHVVDDPCRVAARIARALADRGWTGVPRRCPGCVGVPDRDWGNFWGAVA